MSLDPRTVERMHARIDGTISEADSAELDSVLEKSPEARARFEELQALSERLDRIESVAPPPELRAGVLAALGPRDRPAARRPEKTRTVLRYAYAVAAGLVLGVLAYHVAANRALQGAAVDPADIAGAMSIEKSGGEPGITDRIGIELPGGGGFVELLRVEDHFSLTLDIESPDALEVVLEFDGSRIEFREVAQDVGQIERLAMTAGRLAWSQRGHHRLATRFRLLDEGPATAELQLFRNEERLYDTLLQLPAPE
jgi:hypothetical protein